MKTLGKIISISQSTIFQFLKKFQTLLGQQRADWDSNILYIISQTQLTPCLVFILISVLIVRLFKIVRKMFVVDISFFILHYKYWVFFKENMQFVKQVTYEPFKQNHYRSCNITKAAIFKSFLHLNYKNTQLLFQWTVLFNIFMRQILTNNFWGYTKT